MTDPKVTTLSATAGLKRPALNSSTVSVIATTASAPIPVSVVASKAFGEPITIPDLTRSRKQPNPVKQPSITPLTSGPPQADPVKPKPQPPPLIPAKQSANAEHSYAAQPVIATEVATSQPAKKSGEREKSSSDSSSDDSSSESSSSSGEESEKDEKAAKKPTPAAPPQPVSPAVPQKRGRGRPRKYPRPESATPQPAKSAKEAGKEHKSRTTPRKRASGRLPKPPELFSPNLVSTGVGNGAGEGKEVADLPKKRGRGCGACPGCLRDDCGKCTYCLDKTKFGGPGKKKQRCALRVCSNFVKAVNSPGSSRRLALALTATSGDTPSIPRSEVTPMSKLTNSAKVVQVIEQIKQNLSATPTIEKETTSVVTASTAPAKTTAVASSKPMPLKATPSVVASTIVSEAASVGSTATPSTSVTVVTTSPPTPPTTVPPVLSESKTSEIALRTRRKQQQKEKEPVEEKTDRASDTKMKCIQCGRERKLGMVRSDKFCTQRCMNLWMEANGEKQEEEEEAMEVEGVATTEVMTQQKKVARALKHLQIDMAWSRSSKHSDDKPSTTFIHTVTPSAKPTMTTTPTPTATTAANKRPTTSTGLQPGAAKKTKDADNATGTKRAAQQPPAQKKAKEDTPKSVSFNLIPTSTVDPISAPPLSRTVPPPSISIVPLDQLTALGTALFTQQQKKSKEGGKTNSKIPEGLPVDVRSWTIPQVVKFFESTSDCKDYASVFREQEVDGTALLLLTHESLVKCLGIKLGRALKIMVHVEELQKLYSQ